MEPSRRTRSARLCAARRQARDDNDQTGADRPTAALAGRACPGEQGYAAIYRQNRSDHPGWFQTTVQRWFADPILSDSGRGAPGTAELLDRTMRTVPNVPAATTFRPS